MKNVAAWVWGGIGALIIVGAVWWAATASPAAQKTPTTVGDPSGLMGIRTTVPPEGATTWVPETSALEARLTADNMRPQTMEGQVMHIHQHLDIFLHGSPVSVPANIGINQAAGWLSAIHTHDSTGIIHEESPFKADYTLGQFFDIWGVAFTGTCLGGYCTDATNALKVYAGGKLVEGDPRLLKLADHEEIVITYGAIAEEPTTLPSSYTFPQGY